MDGDNDTDGEIVSGGKIRYEIELTADDTQAGGVLYNIVFDTGNSDYIVAGNSGRLLGSATLENRNTLNFQWEILRETKQGKTSYVIINPAAEMEPKTARIIRDDDKILLLFSNGKGEQIIATKVTE